MALRQAIKISRYLIHHKHKLQPSVCSLSTNPPEVCHLNPVCSKKTRSYSDNAALKIKKVSKKTSDHVKEPEVPEQNVILEPSLEPVIEETVKKEFVKSSTQNAITMPLKMPRLANPFPEPVKCQQSHTVSDAEKARIMLEELKMETKYGLLHQQQTLMKQNCNPINYSRQTAHQQTRPDFTQKVTRRPQTYNENSSHYPDESGRQPNYRRAKNYEQLQKEKLSSNQIEDSRKTSQEVATEPNENQSDSKRNNESKKEGRRKTKTRAPRYLRNLWKQKDQQTRKYSTSSKYFQNDPNVMSEVEQCEKILERIKAMYPETYGHLKKPFCLPGSPEEQNFIKTIFLLSRQTIEKNQAEVKRQAAPIPSYSEVKTLARPKTQLESIYNLKTSNLVDTSRNYRTKNDQFGTNINNYNFLERIKLSEGLEYSDFDPNYDFRINSDRSKFHEKQERNNNDDRMPAPYPSYSEWVEHPEDLEEEVMQYEENRKETQCEEDKMYSGKHDLFDKRRSNDDTKNRSYSTYTTTEQKPINNHYLKQKYLTLFKQVPRNVKNNFSTNMGVLNNKNVESNRLNPNADKNTEMEFIKKKAPCENPYSDLPICDYEEARRKRDSKRKNPKKNSTKKKKCSSEETDVEVSETSLKISKEKTQNVIKTIRKWLSSWRPESENIRVSKFYTDIDGRDTYIIQIDEYEEKERQRKETMEFEHEEEISSHTSDCMEEQIEIKKCEQVQQLNKQHEKTIRKEHNLKQTIPPTAVINKINKMTKMQESETFRIKEKEFIPTPIKNRSMNKIDFNLPVEDKNNVFYLDKKKKNPCEIKKKEKKPKCRQEIKRKLPSCNDIKKEKLDEQSEKMPLAAKNASLRNKQLKRFSFTHSSFNKQQSNIDINPQEIGNMHHEMTENNTKNREMPFKLKQEFWK